MKKDPLAHMCRVGARLIADDDFRRGCRVNFEVYQVYEREIRPYIEAEIAKGTRRIQVTKSAVRAYLAGTE